MFKSSIVLAVLSVALSGCLIQNDGQRALVGGAVGAVAADAMGFDPITGAALGVGAGALCHQAGVGICRP